MGVRPQDPGGGATWIAAPQGVVDMEMSVSSVVEPQSVPSRISVMLVEEAKVRGTECLVSPHVDKDPRLLAGVASPASVTVDKGGNMSPCVVGTLSQSDSDSVGPVGLYGTLFPSDTAAVGPVGPDGTLSSSDLAGILFPAVPDAMPSPVGLIGLYGTLSLSDSDSEVFVIQASVHGSEGGTQSGKLLNVPQIANHEIGVSYSDAHYVEPPAENHPTAELGVSINACLYPWISYQLASPNNAAPEKVLHTQPTLEQFQTEPTHGPSPASCPGETR